MCLRRFVLVRVQRTATESSSKMILNIVPLIKVNVSSAKAQSAKQSGCRECAGVCGKPAWAASKSELRLESKLKSGSTKFQA